MIDEQEEKEVMENLTQLFSTAREEGLRHIHVDWVEAGDDQDKRELALKRAKALTRILEYSDWQRSLTEAERFRTNAMFVYSELKELQRMSSYDSLGVMLGHVDPPDYKIMVSNIHSKLDMLLLTAGNYLPYPDRITYELACAFSGMLCEPKKPADE